MSGPKYDDNEYDRYMIGDLQPRILGRDFSLRQEAGAQVELFLMHNWIFQLSCTGLYVNVCQNAAVLPLKDDVPCTTG